MPAKRKPKPLTKTLRVVLDITVEPLRFANRRRMVAADRRHGWQVLLPETVTAEQAADPLRNLPRVSRELELIDVRKIAPYYRFADAKVVDAKFVR